MLWIIGLALIAIALIAIFGPWAIAAIIGAFVLFLALGREVYLDEQPTINGRKRR